MQVHAGFSGPQQDKAAALSATAELELAKAAASSHSGAPGSTKPAQNSSPELDAAANAPASEKCVQLLHSVAQPAACGPLTHSMDSEREADQCRPAVAPVAEADASVPVANLQSGTPSHPGDASTDLCEVIHDQAGNLGSLPGDVSYGGDQAADGNNAGVASAAEAQNLVPAEPLGYTTGLAHGAVSPWGHAERSISVRRGHTAWTRTGRHWKRRAQR